MEKNKIKTQKCLIKFLLVSKLKKCLKIVLILILLLFDVMVKRIRKLNTELRKDSYVRKIYVFLIYLLFTGWKNEYKISSQLLFLTFAQECFILSWHHSY